MLDLDFNKTIGMHPDKIATRWSSDFGILPWKVYQRYSETCLRERNWVKHMRILWVRTLDTSGTKQKPDRTLYFMGGLLINFKVEKKYHNSADKKIHMFDK